MISFQTRKIIWHFYHDHATPPTNTSYPAKLKLSERNNIQTALYFADTTHIVVQRRKQFYENNYLTSQELYQLCMEKNPNNWVSHCPFFALKPFYIRTETEKDIEMCCSKLHLHARWTVGAMIQCANNQKIDLTFVDYSPFFNYLTQNCSPGSSSYLKGVLWRY